MKLRPISSVAVWNAESQAGPRRPSFMYSPACPAADKPPPPNKLPSPFASFEPTPSAFAWNVER